MKAKLASLLAGFVLVLGLQAYTVAAPATLDVESQVWWSTNGITVPSAVGQHIHMRAQLPLGPQSGTMLLPVTVTLHNQSGTVNWVRVCRESSNCQMWKAGSSVFGPALGPCADCSRSMVLPVNVGAWPSGRQEMRLTANVNSNDEGNRQFQSTGIPIQVRSGTSCPRCSVFWTARGWYEGRGYANAELESDPLALRPGAAFKVYAHPGSDGKPTKFSGVYIDSDFHHGIKGVVIKEYAGSFRGSLTMPALASGSHRLIIISSDGFNAGVLAIGFVAP